MTDGDVAETPKPLNLAQKILAIQNSVGVVAKKGRNKEQGWDYLRIEDAVLSVNKLLASHSLILTPTLQKKPDGSFYYERIPHATKGYIVSVVLIWTMEDVTTGDCRSWNIPGDGYDTTDKAVYKAMTGSRKTAIIHIFNLPVGNDVEEKGLPTVEESKKAQRSVADRKIAEAVGKGSQAALDAITQVEHEKKLLITRPEELNGHYIVASGYIADPVLEQFFEETGCKRFKSKTNNTPYWRVPADYEEGLIKLCERLKVEVEG
jgi:hypothetical protein